MYENEQSEVNSVSIQKLEANRRNALHSTGPKTREGKANVRLNALKHGFLSKQIVISSKAIGEDPKEFEALLSSTPGRDSRRGMNSGAARLAQRFCSGYHVSL